MGSSLCTDEIQIYLILLQDSLIVRVPRGPPLVDQEHSPLLTNVTPCPCEDIPNPMREATGTAAITVNELGTTMQSMLQGEGKSSSWGVDGDRLEECKGGEGRTPGLHAMREGNIDLVAQLAAEVLELTRQGKRDAVKRLFSGDAETSDDFECPYKLGCGGHMTLQGVLLPIIEGRLYLTCTSSSAVIQPQKRELWLAFNESMCHSPLRDGFGALNLGTTHRMCKKLQALLSSPEHRRTKIIFRTSTQAADVTSAVALLGAFLCLRMGYSVARALRPFKGLHHCLIKPFRDATGATLDLDVGDCLAAIKRAVSAGIFKSNEFCPLQRDMHEVLPGKFIVFRGDWQADTLERGDSTLSASDYLDTLRDKSVSTIIHLSSIQHSAAVFKRAGFKHFDLPSEDCQVPSDSIVDEFLRIAEEARGVVAVQAHCLDDHARTGTLIALYLMKHHGFTAREAMCWIRMCRPATIFGPQQHYLEQQQSRMCTLGGQACAALSNLEAPADFDHSAPYPTTSSIRPYATKDFGQRTIFRRDISCEMDMGSIAEEKDACNSANADTSADSPPCPRATLQQLHSSGVIAQIHRQGVLRGDCLGLGGVGTRTRISDHRASESCDEEGSQVSGRTASSAHTASSLESAASSVISRASVVESFCSRADTLCGAEHVDFAARRLSKVLGPCMLSERISAVSPWLGVVTLDPLSRDVQGLVSEGVASGADVDQGTYVTSEADKEMQYAHDTFLFAQSDLVVSYDDKLGQGSTGTVYRGIVSKAAEVAVKVMNANMEGAQQQQALADLRQEIVVGKIMPTHPNLPVFVGVCETLSKGPMVMWKLVDGHNLHELVRDSSQSKGKAPWKPNFLDVVGWSEQMFSALACLHSHGLMHRDVKPGNIMLDALHKMLVLVDFGLCRSFEKGEVCKQESVRCMTGIVGTYRFMAPEVFRKEHYDAKIDVYSGSMVVYVMLFGKLPFADMSGEAVAKIVARVGLQPDFSSCKNKIFASLLLRASDMDPNLRPHAHEMHVEIKTLHGDLLSRKKEKISSKVTSGFLSVFALFRRV